nr:hypothetical protein [uncultured Allomuricauda sp.]
MERNVRLEEFIQNDSGPRPLKVLVRNNFMMLFLDKSANASCENLTVFKL